jgi:hypothetical protein
MLITGMLFIGCAEEVTPVPEEVTEDTQKPESITPEPKSTEKSDEKLIQPDDLVYMGAFRLPEASGESNWEYSGYAMTYYPEGDSNNQDGFPGSLFIIGHDHHQQISEVSIPVPVVSKTKDFNELNTATTLQEFHDISEHHF